MTMLRRRRKGSKSEAHAPQVGNARMRRRPRPGAEVPPELVVKPEVAAELVSPLPKPAAQKVAQSKPMPPKPEVALGVNAFGPCVKARVKPKVPAGLAF